jgi:hypothetical protein
MYTDFNIVDGQTTMSGSLFGGVAGDDGLFEFNSGLNDNGDAISCYVTTPWMSLGGLGERYRLRRLDILADESDNAITVDVFIDLEFDTAKASYSYDPATGTQNRLDQSAVVDDFHWQYLCVRFTQNGDDEDMNLLGWGASISSRPSPRGRRSETGYSA